MFGTIRKHQRWLWIFIIAAVIVSFVIYFSPNQNHAGQSGDSVIGVMDGFPVTQHQLSDIHRQAELSGFLRYGENYRSPRAEQMGFNLKQETMQRLFLSLRLKEYGIQVSDPAVVAWIKEYLKDPKTGTVNFGAFVQNALHPAGFTTNQFLDFVRHEVGVQELERVIGVAGQLVPPQEAEAEFREQNETLTVSLVSFVGSNYLAGVKIDDLKLGEFFTNRLAAYRIPERITLTYVRFGTTNFTAAVESELAARPNLGAEIEQMYQQRGPEAFRDPAGTLLSKEAALAQIREALVRQRALQMAAQKANEFANELYQMEPLAAGNLATLAQRQGLTVETTPPFAETDRPLGLDDLNPSALSQGLSQITTEQPFLTPMAGSRGVVVAAVTDRIPSIVPPFDTMRAKVTSDYTASQSTEAARAAGRAFQAAATNALSQGKTFADAAAAAAVTAMDYSFSQSSPTIAGLEGRLSPAQLKNAVQRLTPGSVSEFVPTIDGGFVVTIRERKPVAEETVKAALNSFLAELRQRREREAFNTWFVTEYNKSGANEIAKRLGL
ncbi:MAG TPA: peptidyl-prolyl cis-trans isomerase [Verrucomicrobiota bacterium]|nr:hypothetical protein [Verrucomicrobiales bacterium]HRI15440.1 peptidyl-prolyl cis-trans isomerase [Verrucomicrobiota bacterium]